MDEMISTLFERKPPEPGSTLLDPGCGEGAFIEGVLAWCKQRGYTPPHITGVELNPRRLRVAQDRIGVSKRVRLVREDFLLWNAEDRFDYVVGNPPYVSIGGLSEREKYLYRRRCKTAQGRFDLYALFFEKGLELLRPHGRLVFITPEKFLYVDSTSTLRKILARHQVESVQLLPEDTFPGRVTYPVVTSVSARPSRRDTRLTTRLGEERAFRIPNTGSSWQPLICGYEPKVARVTLKDISRRVSCGVATGADEIFVVDPEALPPELTQFARPSVAGRQLGNGTRRRECLLLPYAPSGSLLSEARLGALGKYLSEPSRKARLESRTCVDRVPWYAFHETPMLADMSQPKIICKDIARHPEFWADFDGLVPRHSTYYIVPKNPAMVLHLVNYLNSPAARHWLEAHCQRAANGFIRLQSNVLKNIPIPEGVVEAGLLSGKQSVPPATRSG